MIVNSKEKLESILKTCSSILFDFDGTLFDLHISWGEIKDYIYNHYKSKFGEEITQFNRFYAMFDFIKKEKGEDEKQFYYSYLENQEVDAANEKQYSPMWLANQGLDKIGELINYDTFFGIISSNFHDTIMEILIQRGMFHRFKIIIGRDDVENAKPNPEGILRVINAYNLKREDVLFIGDSFVDEEAAQNAQIYFINVENLQKFLS